MTKEAVSVKAVSAREGPVFPLHPWGRRLQWA